MWKAKLMMLLVATAAAACGAGGGEDAGVVDAGADAGVKRIPASCEATAPTSCPDPSPVYADVEPLFQQYCVICHDDVAGGPWPLTAYKDVADWHDTIRADLLFCTMPPADAGVVMTLEDRMAILTWLKCGFPQ